MNVSIVDFQTQHQEAFRDLNYEWISNLFEIEASDRKMLENPQDQILSKGGAILIAEIDGEAVGTCALIKMDKGVFELAKMAVAPKAQGQQVGYKLGLAVIEKAKAIGAKSLFLETNSSLAPAIALYQKLGFEDTSGHDSAYSCCNVQMTLAL